MSLGKPNVVDWLGVDKQGRIVLTVVDDEDWRDEQGHIVRLQTKLNTYLAFIESGEVFERLHSEVGRVVPRASPIVVNVLAKYPRTPRANEFLTYAAQMIADAGFLLEHKVLDAD